MILRDLQLNRLPGIDPGFNLEIGPGLNLIVGPNGSGKTSICRAISQLLWPRRDVATPLSVSARWLVDDVELHSSCESNHATVWQREGINSSPPDLPSEHLAACYQLGILELLKHDADQTDTDLANRIRTQMAGGFDLTQAAQACFSVRPRAGQTEAASYTQAMKRVTVLRQKQDSLAEQELSLVALEKQEAACTNTADQLELWEAASQLAATRQQLALAESSVQSFPGQMARVNGLELNTLDEIRHELDRDHAQIQEHERELERSQKALDKIDLAKGPIAAPELQRWRKNNAVFRECQTNHTRAVENAASATARQTEAGQQLNPEWDAEDTTAVSMRAVQEAGKYLRQHRLATLSRDSVDTLIRHQKLATEPSQHDAAMLAHGMTLLDHWLTQTSTPLSPWRMLAGLLTTLAAGIFGVSVALAGNQPWAWALAGAGICATGAIMLWGWNRHARHRRTTRERQHLAEQYAETGLRIPAAWKQPAVKQCLSWLARASQDLELARLKEDLKEHFIAEKQLKDEELAGLQEQRLRLIAEFQADPEAGDLDVFVFAQRVQAYNSAREAAVGAAAAVTHLSEQFAKQQTEINTFMTAHGRPEVTTPDAAEAVINELEQQTNLLLTTQQDIERESRFLADCKNHLEQAQIRARALFEGLDLELDDDQGLAHLVRQYPAFSKAVQERDHLQRNVDDLRAGVENIPAGADHPDLFAKSPGEIDQLIERGEAAKEQRIQIARDIQHIRTAVEHTRRAHDYEDALAERDRAWHDLADKCTDLQERSVGAMLLERIQAEYEHNTEPPVLARARQLFETFSFGCYRLLVADDQNVGDSFRVSDSRTGEGLSLRQLSDGTRAQLLLAARLAFIIENEERIKPPLLLDESLTSSDPERFDAIATSLMSLSEREGRQLFYLTSNPADLQAWQRAARTLSVTAPTVIDLGIIRKSASGGRQPDLAIPELPTAPVYDKQSAAAYGKLISATPLNAATAVGAVHLFHLLRDDLPLLSRLLQAHVSTIGQWRLLAGAVTADGSISQQQTALLHLRCDIAAAFINNRRIGCGRKVDAETLRASGCVSDTFLEAVTDLCTSVAGQAGSLITALEARKVKNFRSEKIATLEQYFITEGYIDTREVLTEEALRQQVIRTIEPQIHGGTGRASITVQDITRLVHDLCSAIES